MQPYTHLDLLAPMPDVEIDKPRVLMLEGNLKYRDHATKVRETGGSTHLFRD